VSFTAIRPARDADSPGLFALIAACWAEFPGLLIADLDPDHPAQRCAASYCAGLCGAVFVAERDGAPVGTIATTPAGDGAWEIKRFYVVGALRGAGLAQALLATAERYAVNRGAARLVLWTDTRFDRAHAFYEKHGYVRLGPIRALDDLSRSLEFRYAKPLGPCAVERLDAAGAASAARRLSDVLIACVAAGASVNLLPPLAPDAARAYWREVSARVGTGKAVLLAAWFAGELVGTAQLALDTPADQPHRAGVKTLLVHPAARRHGVGRALMDRAETEAAQAGRRLLTLDTQAGRSGEALYRALGWHEGGRIPGYSLDADGTAHDTVFFWKALEARDGARTG
jgi:GNAT superfamily N-acetyltransferase